MPVLCVESGVDKGRKVRLKGDRAVVMIGRADNMDLRLKDPLVSSHHCRVIMKGDKLAVEDLESTNGLFLNDEPVQNSVLKIGDVIRAGETYITLQPVGQTKTGKAFNMPDLPGFTIEKRIGVGGMGVVFSAKQISLDRQVAIKILSPALSKDLAVVKGFLKEGRAAGQLNHANVVQVHDVSDMDGIFYMVMEYMPGGSLADILRKKKTVDEERVVEIAIDVARGLEYAEKKSIVHCDIKPENIMFHESGQAKIADLGIARRISEQDKTGVKEVMGSPHYMSPEQAMGKAVDHRTDLYALGCTLYHALAGRPPFTGRSPHEIMKQQVHREPEDIQDFAPDVTNAMADLVHILMEKKPADRFASSSDLIEALEKHQAKLRSRTKGKKKRNKAVAIPSSASVARMSSSARARARTHTSSSWMTFAPLAIVAVVILGLIGVGVIDILPDRGKAAYVKALQCYKDGEYEQARLELNKVAGSSNPEVQKKMDELEKRIEFKLGEKMIEQKFMELWNNYAQMVKDKAPKDEIRIKLERMLKQYGHDPGKAGKIKTEILRFEQNYDG